MSEPLTHSDLIYLFVDGEATPAERSKLYEALANNPELQSEFEDAMRMKEAVEREVTTAIPPPSLTEALFLRAGVAVPVAVSSAVAPAVPALTNIANSGWFALVKTFALPALAVTGAMTYGVIKLTENTPLPAQAPQAISRTIEDHRSLPQMITTISPETPAMADAELVKKTSQFNAVRKSGVSVIHENTPAVKMASEPPVTQEKIVANTAVDNPSVNNSQLNTPVVQKSNADEVAIASVPSAAINELSPSTIKNISDNEGAKITHNPFGIRDNLSPRNQTGITVSAERYFGSSFIQDRSGKVPSASTMFNNTTLSVMFFQPAEHISVGAAGGEESFPLYLLKANGNINADPTLTWFGIATEYSPFNIAGVNITAREIIGASVEGAGIINKLKAGVNYNLTGAVNISAGYEWTELFYNSHNTTLGAGKTAWTTGLSYTF
ncbi:MAG TPA: hypothetical protein VFO76_08405 [Candidatus Kapabacteria bacterium]|nr:hypothetical protein [Candidatus Kapabacteria bacterium]